MRVNEHTAITTSKVLLVPYDAHHVKRYHEWMQNEDLREATASDQLTLAEEYENQQSWRTAQDKLTFIVCLPKYSAGENCSVKEIYAGFDDQPRNMVGDVNLFLTPCDEDSDDDDPVNGDGEGKEGEPKSQNSGHGGDVKGEIDIMIAAPEDRRKGLGEAAVRAFLRYLAMHQDAIMDEYSNNNNDGGGQQQNKNSESDPKLKILVAKIHADNAGSIRLFENLGFCRKGEPDYFNEVTMALAVPALGKEGGEEKEEPWCRERAYDRSFLWATQG